MTIISDRIEDVGGQPLRMDVTFTVPRVRDSADSSAVVAPLRYRFKPVDGVITTDDMDPGPAIVHIPGPNGGDFHIEIPVSSTPVRLWPLIDAAMPTPPPDAEGFVRNGGGLRRIKAVTQAQYSALVTPDPETLYVIVDSEVTA